MAKKDEILARWQALRTLMAIDKSGTKVPLHVLINEIEKTLRVMGEIPKGEPGKDGEKGEKGDSVRGPRGPEGRTVVGPQGPMGPRGLIGEGREGRPGRTPARGIDYMHDGDMFVISNEAKTRVLEELKPKELWSLIKKLEKEVKDLQTRPEGSRRGLPEIMFGRNGGGGGARVFFYDEGDPLGQDTQDVDFRGSGVSATRVGTRVVVTISGGGGGGTNILTEKVVATQSGDNALVDLTQLTHPYVVIEWIAARGRIYDPGSTDPGEGWTQAGDIATLYGTDANSKIQVCYTYA